MHTNIRNVRSYAALLALLVLLASLVLFVAPTRAQNIDWAQLPTRYFVILHAPDEASLNEAQAYAGFVDQVYDDIATQFNHRVEVPLTLRLYPTFESYYAVNPLARDMPGIVAHADFRRRELAVVLPRTEQQTLEEIQNNIRHELTHIVASDLSENRLNTGFQEGIAQYVEIPTPEFDRKMQLMQQAVDTGRLITWSDLDNRDRIYGEPDVGYPQSLSIVAFLIENYGFEKFREFVIANAQSNGYRTALQQTYLTPPSQLEEQWLAWLPSYLDGTYRDRPIAGFDLGYPTALLEQGRYAEAENRIECGD
ncbi:MAG: hypothetical protein HC893_11120 [Chloroflexaceae bacterium]|nr:hypothetical protein [Chloroflexaceae bacterium]